MIVLTKPYVLIYNDGTVQNIIKENSGKVYPSANSEYAEFDTELEMNNFINKNKLEIPEWILNPEMAMPEMEETDIPDVII